MPFSGSGQRRRAINLFSGMVNDFHTRADSLAGMISAVALLALLGGRLRKPQIQKYPVTAAAD